MWTWYQRANVVTNTVEWVMEPPCYWQPRDHFKAISSVQSAQMPRAEWFKTEGYGQQSYRPS